MMQAEWAPQAALCLVWPRSDSDWQPWISAIRQTFVQIIEAVLPHQAVILLATTDDSVVELQQQFPNLQVLDIPTNDTWYRDFSAVAVNNGLVRFQFNGWGNKYAHEADNAATDTLLSLLNIAYQSYPLTLEGGNLESDGNGTVMVSESCLLKNRNPGYSLTTLLQSMQDALQCKQILLVKDCDLPGDDTDGHIDNLARFANQQTLFYYDLPNSTLAQQVKAFRNADNHPYDCIALPAPSTPLAQHIPASYLNFVITNKVILLPAFACDTDSRVQTIFEDYFPNHQICPIDSTTLIQQFGGLHCATASLPLIRTSA